MKELITKTSTFIIAIIGLLGGSIWAYKSKWEIEPLIIASVSLIEILTYLTLKFIPNNKSPENQISQTVINNEKIKKQVNIQNNSGKIEM